MGIHRSLLIAAAAVLLITSTVAQDANETTTFNATTPAGGLSNPEPGSYNTTVTNVTSLTQTVPAFTGIRSCLPFNILVAAPPTTLDTSNSSNDGRIVVEAEYNVINSTVVAIEDGILTLSLSGGFETRHPINFTVVVPAGGSSQLRHVANYGSGLVVLGPGLNVSSIRLVSPSVGQIQAVNLTADLVSVQASGVLGSSVSGSIKRADISSTGTGTITFMSSTPVDMTLKLSGISTVVADVPAGSSITGTASGLSKVQYTAGKCSVTSDTPVLFAAPSIFGGAGFGGAGGIFGQKCQRVSAAQLQPVVAAAANPEWTCGIIVDGQLSCQGDNATVLPWNATSMMPATPAEASGGPTAPNASDNTATTPTVNAIGIGANAAGANNAGAGTTSQNAVITPESTTTGGSGSGRKLLQPLVATTTTEPPGLIGTGAQTTGPGTFASGTGSVSGPGGSTSQTTSSEGGSQPQTTLSTGGIGSNLYNPVYVPATPAQTFAAEANATGNVTTPVAAPTVAPTSSISTATSGAAGPSVSTSTSGPGVSIGVAVASTTCASRMQSLSMLVQPMQGMVAGSGPLAAPAGSRTAATSGAMSSAVAGSPSPSPLP